MTTRVMIAGSIESLPLFGGGNTWAFLQYILGFRRLGIETYYVEQLERKNCIDDDWKRASFSTSANARHFDNLIQAFDLADHASLLESDGEGYVGLPHDEVEKLSRDIDLLINISGRLHFQGILRNVRRRMYLDLDPGYTQLWQEQYGTDMNFAGHDVYVTVGLNLGEPDCAFPTCGIPWEKSLPPVVLQEWQTTRPPGKTYSTVADWRGFGAVEWRGVWYGQKSDEFKRIIDLPRRVAVPLELCLFIHSDESDRNTLERHGWQIVAPEIHAKTTNAYRAYIIDSRGEFTTVKQGYVAGRTGWFSDRSGCYLAAGRPVIIQDTGIGKYLPTGSGLLTFTDIDSAAEAIDNVEKDYVRHAAAAASFARQFLDSDIILARLLRLVGI